MRSPLIGSNSHNPAAGSGDDPGDGAGRDFAAFSQPDRAFAVLLTRREDLVNPRPGGGVRALTRARGLVIHPDPALLTNALEPPVRAGTGNTHFLDHMGQRPAFQNTLDQDSPTGRRQTGTRGP
jgi:hypothetical protein